MMDMPYLNKPLCLYVRVTLTSKILVAYADQDSVWVLKKDINQQTGIPIDNQCLRYKTRHLSNEQSISSYGIEGDSASYGKNNNNTVHLSLEKTEGQIMLQIKTWNGDTYEWYTKPSETFYSIKERIGRLVETPFEKRTLYNGRMLLYDGMQVEDESNTLADYGMMDGSTIFIIGQSSTMPSSWKLESGGCKIPQTELRAITVGQLKDLVIEIYRRCEAERWTSTNPMKNEELLMPEDVTLYDVVEHFIKVQTKEKSCSYVETVASGPQKPDWFVSHWWGEPVVDFVSCIEQHAFDRGLDNNTTYWVCGYALNQHNVDNEVGGDPKDSPFFKAMCLSKGTVTILDCECVCYTRIWCSYEVYLCNIELVTRSIYAVNGTGKQDPGLSPAEQRRRQRQGLCLTCAAFPVKVYKVNRQKLKGKESANEPLSVPGQSFNGKCLVCNPQLDPNKTIAYGSTSGSSTTKRNDHLYDIYTITNPSGTMKFPVGLTDGCVASDKNFLNEHGTFERPKHENGWFSTQMQRQKDFPRVACRKALGVRLETANASKEKDRIRILNSIVGNTNNLDQDPPSIHARYDEVNALLRGKFAVSGYSHALDEGEDMTEYRAAIRQAPLHKVEMSLGHCQNFYEEAEYFCSSLPTSLEILDLSFDSLNRYIRRGWRGEDALVGLGRLTNLISMKLSYGNSHLNGDFMVFLGKELDSINKLESLSLDFSDNEELSSIDGLERVIETNKGLTSLAVRFGKCCVSSFDKLASSLAGLKGLKILELWFDETKISSLDKLANSLVSLTRLEVLELDVSYGLINRLGDETVLTLLKALTEHHSESKMKLRLYFQYACRGYLSDLISFWDKDNLERVYHVGQVQDIREKVFKKYSQHKTSKSPGPGGAATAEINKMVIEHLNKHGTMPTFYM